MTREALEIIEHSERNNALLDYLFPAQRAAILDPSRKKVIWKTRRAGGTTAVIADFLDDGMRYPRSKYAYIALTQPSAEEIAWNVIHDFNYDFDLGVQFQQVKLKATMPGGSYIRLYGADKPNWMKRLYGQKFRGIAIDEAAFFSIDLKTLIIDILEPATADQNGFIYLISIPGYLPKGLFHDAIKGFPNRVNMSGVESPTLPGYSVHSWTTDDNPKLRDKFRAQIARLRKENPNIDVDPRFRRNYLGESVIERGQRVYHFDFDKNNYNGTWQNQNGDKYILGIDLGWGDATAFSLNVWRDDSPNFVEIESYKAKEMMLDKTAAHVQSYVDYVGGEQNITLIGDAGHKQIFEEFRRRFDLPIIPAEKTAKYDLIELYNSELARGMIKICDAANSLHVEEMQDLIWKELNNGKKIEQPGADNDCCDAALMAFQYAYHYRFEEKKSDPKPYSNEWYEREEREMIKQLELEDSEREGLWYEFD